MTKLSRALLNANADDRFPDQYDEAITPEVLRQQEKDNADSHFNLTDDDYLLHIKHYETKAYKIGDVIYKDGNFYKSKNDHTGAFNIANWEYFASIKNWTAATFINLGSPVVHANALYIAQVEHTSGVSFATDLAAGKWQMINGRYTSVATGTDTYVTTSSTPLAEYSIYQVFLIKFTNANTGAATLNVDGLGVKPIKKNVTEDLGAGDISDGLIIELIYDGTSFQAIGLINPGQISNLPYSEDWETDELTGASKAVLFTIIEAITAGILANEQAIIDGVQEAKDYADSLVIGLWDDRGNYDASTDLFPSSGGSGEAGAILKGDIWTVSVAGTLGGEDVNPPNTVRALIDTPGQTSSNWAIASGNLGYVPEPAFSKNTAFNKDKASEQEVMDHVENDKLVTPLILKKHTMITKLNLYTNFG